MLTCDKRSGNKERVPFADVSNIVDSIRSMNIKQASSKTVTVKKKAPPSRVETKPVESKSFKDTQDPRPIMSSSPMNCVPGTSTLFLLANLVRSREYAGNDQPASQWETRFIAAFRDGISWLCWTIHGNWLCSSSSQAFSPFEMHLRYRSRLGYVCLLVLLYQITFRLLWDAHRERITSLLLVSSPGSDQGNQRRT